MKVRITFKDPDAISNALDDACATFPTITDDQFTEDERTAMREAGLEARRTELHKVFARWFEHLEYVTLELDTLSDGCTVVPNRLAKAADLSHNPLAARVAQLEALLSTEQEHSKSLRAECEGLRAVVYRNFVANAWPQSGPVRAAYLHLEAERSAVTALLARIHGDEGALERSHGTPFAAEQAQARLAALRAEKP